jgi:long-chain fatty acid transport protein
MKRFVALVSVLVPSVAFAGGFELPDNNAEALARGGAFTAKADDGSAQEYNIAGFARQRGTRMLLSANTLFHTYEFQRAGNYPAVQGNNPGADPTAYYAGTPFPKISNQNGPFFAPFFGLSTDFGYFDRWTFAVGAFGPSAYGQRVFPQTLPGSSPPLPSPGRYDLIAENLLIVYPTLSAAVRVTKWLDVGLALHLVYGSFLLSSSGIVDLSRGICRNGEYQPCDSDTTLNVAAFTATAALGLMFHPLPTLDIGVNLRGPVKLDATGTANGTPPAVQSVPIDPQPAEFHTKLPWVLRVGLRWAFVKDRFEHGDIEVDGTYEAWADAQNPGSQVNIPSLSIFNDINPVITHNYQDTYSLRMGGAYNLRLPAASVLTFRLGFFFDSAATKYKDTRIDFDTMAKYAPTVGIGYRVRGVAFNIAYAYVWSPDRDVTNGDIRLINALQQGQTIDTVGNPTPVVNNGHYHAETQILSFSINIAWDEALQHHRVLAYE